MKIHSDMIKLEEIMCHSCVCYSNIYVLYTCKSEIIRNWLVGYLTFNSVIGNLETTNRLTGYSVKVQNTKVYCNMSLVKQINVRHLNTRCCISLATVNLLQLIQSNITWMNRDTHMHARTHIHTHTHSNVMNETNFKKPGTCRVLKWKLVNYAIKWRR